MQRGAGERARFPDDLYNERRLRRSAATVLAAPDVLLNVQPPTLEQIGALEPGAVVIGFMQPHARRDACARSRSRHHRASAIELLPRISRAQSMDALSSQAAIAGYKAVLLAAERLQKFFPMLTTAAGTIRPARCGDRRRRRGPAGDRHRAAPRRRRRGVRLRAATKEQVRVARREFVDPGVARRGPAATRAS